MDYSRPDRPAKCPECGLLMAAMGLDFAPPRRSATKQWVVVEALWDVGITFMSCGCSGPGYRPRNARDYVTFLGGVLDEYRRTLRAWMDRPASTDDPAARPFLPKGASRDEAIATWQDRVRRVEEALATAQRGRASTAPASAKKRR